MAVRVLRSDQSAHTPAVPQSRDRVEHLNEASTEPGVHVAINKRIVAAVRHRQPVAAEPDEGQRGPGVHTVVVENELEVTRRSRRGTEGYINNCIKWTTRARPLLVLQEGH